MRALVVAVTALALLAIAPAAAAEPDWAPCEPECTGNETVDDGIRYAAFLLNLDGCIPTC